MSYLVVSSLRDLPATVAEHGALDLVTLLVLALCFSGAIVFLLKAVPAGSSATSLTVRLTPLTVIEPL